MADVIWLLLACLSEPGGPYEACQECCDEKMHEGVEGFVADEPDALQRVQANDACRHACVEDVRSCEATPRAPEASP